MTSHEQGTGLKWRTRTNGTRVAYWVCNGHKQFARFQPRTVRLWSGVNPTEADLIQIENTCKKLQAEMNDWIWSPERKKPSHIDDGRIYFIRGGNLVKVGFTAGDPHKRLNRLQTGSATRLVLLGCIPGTQVTEKKLHWQFRRQSSHGEWFHIRGVVAKFLIEKFMGESNSEQPENKRWGTSLGTPGTSKLASA